MLRELVYNWLVRKRDEKRHEVMRLRWRKTELERTLETKKNEVKLHEEY